MEQGSAPRGEGELLVDHGEDAAGRGVDGEGGAVHVAQGIEGGGADDGIFAGGDVAEGEVVGKGVSCEALVVDVLTAAVDCEDGASSVVCARGRA